MLLLATKFQMKEAFYKLIMKSGKVISSSLNMNTQMELYEIRVNLLSTSMG